MTTNLTKRYTVGRVLVEGTLSEGGSFYEIKIVQTGERLKCLVKVFEKIAKEVKDGSANLSNSNKIEGPPPS